MTAVKSQTSKATLAGVCRISGNGHGRFVRSRRCEMEVLCRVLYSPQQTRLTRLVIKHNGGAIGWATVGGRRKDAKYGNLRVASVVDCFALPGEMISVVNCATQTLESQGFDLILSNQSHEAWAAAFKAAGYHSGPSNFIFAASRKLGELLAPFEKVRPRMHLTRADGDGLPGNF